MSNLAELDANELERRWNEHHGDEYPSIKNVVKVGHLVVAVLAVLGTVGGSIAAYAYMQADRNARIEKELQALHEEDGRKDQLIADIRRHQEIDEGRLSMVERQAAVDDQRFGAMQTEHARIFTSIEAVRTGRR